MADQHNARGSQSSARQPAVKHGQYGPPDSYFVRGDTQPNVGRDGRQPSQGTPPAGTKKRSDSDK